MTPEDLPETGGELCFTAHGKRWRIHKARANTWCLQRVRPLHARATFGDAAKIIAAVDYVALNGELPAAQPGDWA